MYTVQCMIATQRHTRQTTPCVAAAETHGLSRNGYPRARILPQFRRVLTAPAAVHGWVAGLPGLKS
jgi:hypothetical protein